MSDVEHPGPGRWWWLSFVDVSRPQHRFLGCAIVEGDTLRLAIHRAHRLGINPGGQVASRACTRLVPRAEWRGRLLSAEESKLAQEGMQDPANLTEEAVLGQLERERRALADHAWMARTDHTPGDVLRFLLERGSWCHDAIELEAEGPCGERLEELARRSLANVPGRA